MLSLDVIVDNDPFCTVTSSSELKPETASENCNVTVAVSPIFNAVSLTVKAATVAAVVSTV